MRDESSNTQDRSGHVFNWPAFSYFLSYFILYGLPTKGGSISVPSYGNSRQNRGTNITKYLGSIGRVRRAKKKK